MLDCFLEQSKVIQGVDYFLNGLKNEKLGTVIEALVFKTTQVMQRFTAEMSDLQLICLFQAGQISKPQLQLSEGSQLGDMADK